MIIFTLKVNNPLSFPNLQWKLWITFSVPLQFVFTLFTTLNKCLQKHTWALMLLTSLINCNRTVFVDPSAVYVDECKCYVLIQWRHHTGPRYMFTRLPQQTVSCPSQNHLLQEDTDGRRNNKHSHVEYQIHFYLYIWRDKRQHSQ